MRFLRSKVPRLRGITSFVDWTRWTQNRVSRNQIRSFVRTRSRIVVTIIVDGLKSLVWIHFSSSFNSNVRFFVYVLFGWHVYPRAHAQNSLVCSLLYSPWQQHRHGNNITMAKTGNNNRHSSSHRPCSCLWSVLCSRPHFQCVYPPAFSLRSCL